jgi:hypothetical protein
MLFAWNKRKYFVGISSLFVFTAIIALIITRFRLEQFAEKEQPSSMSNDQNSEWHRNTDTIIVTAHFKEDLTWLRSSPYPVVVCTKEGADKPALAPDAKCSMKYNRGREYGSFLKFIIEYYDNLPAYVVFLHGHQTAWHQQLHIFDAIRCAKKNKFGYISLNNSIFPKMEWSKGNKGYDIMETLWDEHFKPHLLVDMPTFFYHDCCAQFIVSRDRIRLRTKQAYKQWYDLIFYVKNDYDLGLGFEMIWPMIFGESHEIEVSPLQYKQSRFSCAVRDVSHLEEIPHLRKVYVVVMVTSNKPAMKGDLQEMIATIPKSFSNYIVIRQGASSDQYKVFEDGHIEVNLKRDIQDYGFYIGIGMLIKANIIPMIAWYLLVHDTCRLLTSFEDKINTFLQDMSWRVDIFWADRNGRANISLQRRGAITHGANLYFDVETIDPVHLAQMEWGMHASSPKKFPIEQRYHHKTARSVDNRNMASALYFESLDIEQNL